MYKPLETAEPGDVLFDIRWGMPKITKIQKMDDSKYQLSLDDGNTHTVDAYGYMNGDEILRIINIIYGRPLLCKLTNEPSNEPIKIFQYSEILPCHEIVGRVDD